ncbi:hypothetical protein JCM13664_19070 [Methylothermus subterraneus]|nr:hypothetical conserved protein [uncultured Gammaproteobacteria bacterium]
MNELLKFPCAWEVKAFGPSTEQFELEVVQIVRRHVPDLSETAVTTRASRSGKYLAVSVAIRARSRAQLKAIYAELKAHPAVLMTL